MRLIKYLYSDASAATADHIPLLANSIPEQDVDLLIKPFIQWPQVIQMENPYIFTFNQSPAVINLVKKA